MSKDSKIVGAVVLGCTALIIGVIGVNVKPIVQVREVPKVYVVTPTASPSATLVPTRSFKRVVSVAPTSFRK